jgi:hypothetical protein
MRCLTIAVLAACASLAAAPQDAAVEKEVKRLAIPASLTPKGKRPLLLLRADGLQIYEADTKKEWALREPQATLRDYRTGAEVGTHSRGPVWADAQGSKLTGKVVAQEPAPNPDAIPWLLLEVTNANGGRFGTLTHIQRVDTWAGLKPAVGPTKVGETVRVPYQATYIFWGDR